MSEIIIKFISKQLAIDEENITLNSSILEDLGADSLDVVEIVLAIEEETGVTIPDEAILDIKTVGDLVEYVETHK